MALAQKIADTPEAQEVAAMMQRARAAQAIIEDYTQEQIDELITARYGLSVSLVWPRK